MFLSGLNTSNCRMGLVLCIHLQILGMLKPIVFAAGKLRAKHASHQQQVYDWSNNNISHLLSIYHPHGLLVPEFLQTACS